MALADPFVNIPSVSDPVNFNSEAENFFNVQFPLKVSEISSAALAMSLNAVTGTSATSMLIGTGAKTLTTQTAKSFLAGMDIRVVDTTNPTVNYVNGVVTSYVSGTGVIQFTVPSGQAFGAGTLTSWSIFQIPAGGATNTFVQQTIQNQTVNAFVTTGPAPAFVGTPSPAYTAYANFQSAYVNFHAANLGVACTLNISALGARPIKQRDSAGALVDPTFASGFRSRVESDGTNWVIMEQLPSANGTQAYRQTVLSGPAAGDTYTGVTNTVASPAVITLPSAHLKENDTPFYFTTGGTFSTGFAANTQYYARNVSGATLQASATAGGASINTTGSVGSGLKLVFGFVNNANGVPLLGGALGGTSVTTSNINATTPKRNSYANGFNSSGQSDLVGSSTANLTYTGLSTNGTMYLIDTFSSGANVASSTTLAPIRQKEGVPSTTSGQYTYNTAEAVMYLGNGTVANVVNALPVGQVTVAGGVVTAIAWYAYKGEYVSPYIPTLPNTATAINFSSNLGVDPELLMLTIKCTANDNGYVVGKTIKWVTGGGYSGVYLAPNIHGDTLTTTLSNGGASSFPVIPAGGGTHVALTPASWSYQITAKAERS